MDGSPMAVIRNLTQSLPPEAHQCGPGCTVCAPSSAPSAHSVPQFAAATAPTVPPEGGGSLDLLIAHTIQVLRGWGEMELAMQFTEAVINHGTGAGFAAIEGWSDD